MCVQSSSSAWSERNVAKRSRARHHTYTVFRGWRPLCTVSSGRASVYCLAAGRGSCVVAVPVRVLVPRHPRSSLVEFSLIIMNVKTRAPAFPRTAAPRKRNAQPGANAARPRGGPPRRPAPGRGAGSGRCGPRRVQVRARRLGHVRHGACKGALWGVEKLVPATAALDRDTAWCEYRDSRHGRRERARQRHYQRAKRHLSREVPCFSSPPLKGEGRDAGFAPGQPDSRPAACRSTSRRRTVG